MAFPRSGSVDTQTFSGTKDFVLAAMSAAQAANIAANDHVKLDVIEVSRGSTSAAGANTGGAVSLDTATAYSNSNGAASLGRFTLRGGKTYKLTCAPGKILFSGITGVLTLQFFDVTGAPAAIGQMKSIYTMVDGTNDGSQGDLIAMFQPGGGHNDLFLVEVRILAVTALTSIGSTTLGMPSVLVETY